MYAPAPDFATPAVHSEFTGAHARPCNLQSAFCTSATPVPPILSLLDRSTLRLLAAWSPAVLDHSGVASVAVSGVAQPSVAVRREPSAASVSVSGVAQPPPAVTAVSVPSSIINRLSSAFPEPRTPSPEPRPFPPFNLPLLAARSGLTEQQALVAFDLARAHDLIYPDGTLNPHVKDLLDSRNHRVTHFARRRRALANRANALKSTGPRTDEGKVITRLNALKCGLTAQLPVLPSEHDHLYLALHQSLQDEYQPFGPTETIFMDQLAQIAWRLRRAHLAESGLAAHYGDSELQPGQAVLRAADDHTLPKLDRHHTALNRAFIRILHELQELQSARHNTQEEQEMRQVGFVLKNDNPSPSPSGVAQPSGAVRREPSAVTAVSVSGVAQAPSLASVSVPPSSVSGVAQPPPAVSVSLPPSVINRLSSAAPLSSVVSRPSSSVPEPRTPNPEPPSSFSPSAPGARWPSLDDRQPIGPEALLLSVTDPRDKSAETQP